MFKVGDIVKKKNGNCFYMGQKVARVVAVPSMYNDSSWATDPAKTWVASHGSSWLLTSELELATPAVGYEEDWILVRGGITVPPDADVVKSEAGHVVAFRPVKRPKVVEHREKMYKSTGSLFNGYFSRRYDVNIDRPSCGTVTYVETDGVLTDVRFEPVLS